MEWDGSLPIRGAWIEIYIQRLEIQLKNTSLPIRGAWIEIRTPCEIINRFVGSLPIRGAWIEILRAFIAPHRGKRRSPSGERGLK